MGSLAPESMLVSPTLYCPFNQGLPGGTCIAAAGRTCTGLCMPYGVSFQVDLSSPHFGNAGAHFSLSNRLNHRGSVQEEGSPWNAAGPPGGPEVIRVHCLHHQCPAFLWQCRPESRRLESSYIGGKVPIILCILIS